MLSGIYSSLNELRRVLYLKGIFKTHKMPIPVISVGNITLGGTGKTPLIIWLAEYLKNEKIKTGILTRGYGRKNKNKTIILLDNNETPDYNVTGDEPGLIKNNIDAGIPVIVDSNRIRSGSLLYNRFKTDVILLDDGFQHLSLSRDLDIVVVDALNPFGNRKIFPAGILREKIDNIKRADIFLVTKVDLATTTEKNKIVDLVRSISGNAVIVEGAFQADKFVSVRSKKEYTIENVSRKRCTAFSGIGNPDSFERTLKSVNVSLLDHMKFPDHYPFAGKDMDEIFKRKMLLRSDLILTTEKDSIRLYNMNLPEEILFLRIKLKITAGEGLLKEKIKRIIK